MQNPFHPPIERPSGLPLDASAAQALVEELRPVFDTVFAPHGGTYRAVWLEGHIRVEQERDGVHRIVELRPTEGSWTVQAFAYRLGWIARYERTIRLGPMLAVGAAAALTRTWSWAPFALLIILAGWVPVVRLARRDVVDLPQEVNALTARLEGAFQDQLATWEPAAPDSGTERPGSDESEAD